MARKAVKPAWFALTLANEGKMLLTVQAENPVPQTTPTFGADVSLHPDARRGALAVTLCELAAWLVKDDAEIKEICQDAAAACVYYNMNDGLFNRKNDDDELPF